MKRQVRRELIDKWIQQNRPDGVRALANKSKIPSSSIHKIRAGRVPVGELQRASLARAIGVKEAELFPVLADEDERAS